MSTYYVSTLGSDSNNGGPATPWLTPQKAANAMVAGDTCNILGGTYTTPSGAPLTFMANGTAGKYITFQNDLGASVTLNVTSGSYFVNGNSKAYNQIIGINFGGAATYGIWLQSCDHITIDHCVVNGRNQDSCIIGFNSTNLTVTYNTCTASSAHIWDEIISMDNVVNFTVSNNLVVGINMAGNKEGIDAKVGCSNGVISYNVVFNAKVGIYLDARGAESNIKVFGNLVYNCTNGGIGLSSETGATAAGSLTGISIYCNVVYGNVRGFRVDQYGQETYQFTLENNTFYNNSPSGNPTEIFISPTAYSSTRFSGCVIRNNIFYSLTAGAYAIDFATTTDSVGFTIDHNNYYNPNGWNTTSLLGTNNITSNPLLVSPTTNFALQAGSTCIGTASSIGAPTTDYAGNPWTGCIGAYQYQAVGGLVHGTSHTASFQITISPANLSCQLELWLGPNSTTKSATAGLSSSFNSTSTTQQVTSTVTLPAAGVYNIYVDLYLSGTKIKSFVGLSTITVT